MNTVKFRIWNTKTKQWKGFTTDEAYANRCVHFCHKVKDGIFTLSLPEHLVYQRYTSLKDKNGVEIFEGDIVMVNEYLEGKLWKSQCHKAQIIFSDGGFTFSPIWNHQKFSQYGNEVEVLGNIFENPELLK